MVWFWCIDADAILIGACPWMRQRGAQSIQDWPTRNAVSVRSAASRASGRECVSLVNLLDGLMRSKVARGGGEGQAGGGEPAKRGRVRAHTNNKPSHREPRRGVAIRPQTQPDCHGHFVPSQ
jgi:hypothetical protein